MMFPHRKIDEWIEHGLTFFSRTEKDAGENQFSTMKKKLRKKTQHTVSMCCFRMKQDEMNDG
jgi:hypothetical protein